MSMALRPRCQLMCHSPREHNMYCAPFYYTPHITRPCPGHNILANAVSLTEFSYFEAHDPTSGSHVLGATFSTRTRTHAHFAVVVQLLTLVCAAYLSVP